MHSSVHVYAQTKLLQEMKAPGNSYGQNIYNSNKFFNKKTKYIKEQWETCL